MIILIADDEKLNRFIIKSMLGEILTSEYTILEASDGKKMVEICKEKMPDIVFTDIRMPNMNGIEAIAECKKYSDDIEFVIISGYSEFEFAQKALQMGVQDYLLKPVEEERLRQLMDKLQKKISGHKKEQNTRFQLALFNAFNYFSTLGMEEKYEENNFGENLTYEVIGVKSRYSKQNQEICMDFQREMIEKMDVYGKKLLKSGKFYSSIYSPEGTLFFVFHTAGDRKEEICSYVRKFSNLSRKDNLAAHYLYFSADSMREVYLNCEKLDNWQGIEINYPLEDGIDVSDIDISDAGKEVLKYIYQIVDAWLRADAVSYKDLLHRMERKYKDAGAGIDLECVSRYCSLLMQQDIKHGTFREFCQSLGAISENIYGNVEKVEGNVIEQVKSYIEKNYMNDIGIGQIADLFDITPNYLSTIFRQKTGYKFTDYVMKVRIAHAKKMLIQNETTSVNDIAIMVGYNSARYFTQVFQKETGVRPLVYRKENMLSNI